MEMPPHEQRETHAVNGHALGCAIEPRRHGILHLVDSLQTGGLEHVVELLVRHADTTRFQPSVICLREGGPHAERIRAMHVPLWVVPPEARTLWQKVRVLRRRLRAMRPSVVHTHNPGPHLAGALAARSAGPFLIVHTRHGRNPIATSRRRWAMRCAMRLTDAVVAVSRDAAECAKRDDWVPSSQLRVIANGIDVGVFSPRPRPAERHPRAIHVARLSLHDKDQVTLLKAARLVADALPAFQLIIVGDGPDRARIEACIRELSLASHVQLMGERDDVHSLLRQGSLMVLSSVSEGLSMALLEGAAAALPLVATRVGGNEEIVRDGETGLLVPPRDPQALAAAMLRVLNRPNEAAAMGARGRALVELRFSALRMTREYEALYDALLHRGRRAAPRRFRG